MTNFALLARQAAKAKGNKKKTKKVVKPKVETPVDPPKVVIQILAKNPDTGKVEGVFNDIDEAVAGGFNEPNIKRALKHGTKYKGHLWVYSE